MEFVEGGSLKPLLGPGKALPPAEAIRLTRQVLAGLAASHERGIVHRDIKPENIMLRGDQVKIADFGIARISSSRLTQDGTVMGTPLYMSPEQCRGETVDSRTDVWSTGVMLYQMLTGQRPFEGSGFAAIMNKVLNTEPPPPSQLCPPGQVPEALDRAVMKALDKRLTPDGRFASAQDFSRALEAALAEPSRPAATDDRTQVLRPGSSPAPKPVPAPAPAPVPAPAPAPAPARQRSVLPLAGAATVLLVLAGGGAWWWLQGSPPGPVTTPTGAGTTAAGTTGSTTTGSTTTGSTTSGATTTASGAPPRPVRPEPPPPVTPYSPPPPPPEPEPAQTASVTTPPVSQPSLADLRSELDGADCTLVSGTVEANTILLYGIGAADRLAPVIATYRTLHNSAPPGGSYQFAVQTFDPVPAYCKALDIIRPFAAPLGSTRRALALQMTSRAAILREKSPYTLAVTMPDFAGVVQIDYFSGGDVEHLGLWLAGRATKAIAPATVLRLGAGERAAVYENVATDAGTDMVMAIAARDRLFPQPRPETEPAAGYLAALGEVLRSRTPATVSASAIRVLIER